jgi:hypothetical protein
VAVAGELIEIEDLAREKPPPTDLRRYWQAVTGVARVYYQAQDSP